MKYVALFSIILLAGLLRFYQLGSVPPSLDWDETSLGYNAWALSETGRDEFGNRWPLSIRSFGDYKPPLYTYLLIPSLRIFGRTEFAIRFPSAVAGTLTVLVTYFFTRELFSKKLLDVGSWSLGVGEIASFLLAISPWHLQFSRIAFEANVGLFFFVTGLWLLLRWMLRGGWSIAVSSLAFGGALMSYHSVRVVAPLAVLGILAIYRKDVITRARRRLFPFVSAMFIATLVMTVIGYTVLYQGVGQSRFSETSFLTIDDLLTESRSRIERFPRSRLDRIANHRYLVYGKQFLSGYLDHYNLQFFFLDGDRIDRHRTPGVGLLYWWELPFFVVGGVNVIRKVRGKEKSALSLLLLFLLAPTASALTGGTPSAVRSLTFLPTLQIISAVGIVESFRRIRWIKGGITVLFLLSTFYFLLSTVEIFHYLHQYYVHAPIEYARAWQFGYKQTVDRVMREKDRYQRVLVTTAYDQPYIYFLWYGAFDPKMWINDGTFNKRFDRFVFQKIERSQLDERQNSLVVGSKEELGSSSPVWEMNFPDGTPAFIAVERL